MKKYKLFAPFLTLTAVAITYFTMLHFGYRFKDILVVMLIVLVMFYIAGCLIQNRISKFVFENEEKLRLEEEENGAVIEKEADENVESNAEEASEEEEYSLPPLTGAMPSRPGESEDDGFEQ